MLTLKLHILMPLSREIFWAGFINRSNLEAITEIGVRKGCFAIVLRYPLLSYR